MEMSLLSSEDLIASGGLKMKITVLTGYMIHTNLTLKGNTLKVVRNETINYEQVEDGCLPQWYEEVIFKGRVTSELKAKFLNLVKRGEAVKAASMLQNRLRIPIWS